MNEEIKNIFDKSELIYQVKKYFDNESAEKMIEELKLEIIKLCGSQNLEVMKIEQHNQVLNDVRALFNPVFAIAPKTENLIEIMLKFKEGFQGLDAMKK